TSYEYDAEGRLVKTDYCEGSGLENVIYTYDLWGKLLNVKHDGDVVCEYAYNGLGQLTSMKEYKEPGNITAYILKTYGYDNHGRCTSIRYLDNGSETSILESFEYTYDKDDRILTCEHVNNMPAESSRIDETRSYEYDVHGNLIKSIITDHNSEDSETVTTYTYDAVGNRLKITKAGNETAYSYNGLNQLTSVETPTAITRYTYDGRGNQIEEYDETNGVTRDYTYAVTGEMTELTVSNGEAVSYTQENTYNHEGIRISKTEGGVTRRYYYDNGIVAYTKDGTSLSSSNVISAEGEILGTYRDSAYYTYTKDTQNSTASIVNSGGILTAAYSYSDFGETEELTDSTFDNEICYTGAVYDEQTGLYYMNARYYEPENGRFISQDTYRGELDDPGQWHLYVYCANNPINYLDPSGHAKQSSNRIIWEHNQVMYSLRFGDLWELAEAYRTGEHSFKIIDATISVGLTIAGLYIASKAIAISAIAYTLISYNRGYKSSKYYQKCYDFYQKKKNTYGVKKVIYVTEKMKRVIRKGYPRRSSKWVMYDIALSGNKPAGFKGI
ncbi:MAG: RHS repeat-associated core domain-containing protein, partial [Eubacteriaceae bacterium]|nr:RHS repeat-associated core domain-containing protein [Eubacteriaceae bacterium]